MAFRSTRIAPTLPFAMGILTLALSACNSSSDSSTPIVAQAVDGYIVGGSVRCDEIANGGTAAGGRLTCPQGTELMHVSGGSDVGFDANATSGTMTFAGQLVAPSSLSWVTPLSTMAVAMASNDGNFDAGRFHAAERALATALGEPELDLDANPAENMRNTRLNAQLHQIMTAFAVSPDQYGEVAGVFAEFFAERAASGLAIDLGTGAGDTMNAINQRLERDSSALAIEQDQLDRIIASVTSTNQQLAATGTPDGVVDIAIAAAKPSVMGLDREADAVWFKTHDTATFRAESIDGLASNRRIDGQYMTVIPADIASVSLSPVAFDIYEDLNRVPVSMAFELTSTDNDDPRGISAAIEGVKLTAWQGESGTLRVEVPAGTDINLTHTDSRGTLTRTLIDIENGKLFDAIDGELRLRLGELRDALEKHDLEDITDTDGNYRLTMVIGGIAFDMIRNGKASPAERYTVDAGNVAVTGSGLQGYVTITEGSF
ncbi:MAG: hypothetical protein CSB44_07980 [Gammaproteobacteria bacterium]|nr:MAG: hypothetical protein CSB44_07980 [Gammaproteobacteria bacterium]